MLRAEFFNMPKRKILFPTAREKLFITKARNVPASIGGGYYFTMKQAYNLLLYTVWITSHLAALNDVASPY